MEGLRQPVTPGLHRVLRSAVLEHVMAERRRVHLPLLHVGMPGDAEAVFADVEPTDHSLRSDLLAAMLRRAGRWHSIPLVWLTRTGDLELQDVDVRWLASARAAYAEAGTQLVMVVVTRHGWRDPRSGARRDWVRLRT
jgi:hypothetical protein